MKKISIFILALMANITSVFSQNAKPYFIESWTDSSSVVIEGKEYTIKYVIKKYDIGLHITYGNEEPDHSNPTYCLWTVSIPAQNFDAMLKIGAIKFYDIRDNDGSRRGQTADDLTVSWYADPSIINTDEFELASFKNCILYYKARLLTDEDLAGISKSDLAEDQKISLFNPSGNNTNSQINNSDTLNGIDMVFVKGGTFQMGSNDSEAWIDEQPIHSVTVRDFYISKYEVTVAEFEKFINETGYQTDAEKSGWSWIWTGSEWNKENGVTWRCDVSGNIRPRSDYNHPVIHVSWNDAVAYCEWLSQKTGKTYRLPTEAEWEYAARGGSKSRGYKYSGSNNIDAVAWYRDNSGDHTHPVGTKSPNELGIYDMSGNVWEWCSDWYKGYPGSSGVSDLTGSDRVLRGGSWISDASNCRVAYRNRNAPDYRHNSFGFRLVRAY